MLYSINNFLSTSYIRCFLNIVDILLIAAIIYVLYLLLYNTRAYVVVRGLIIIFTVAVLSRILGLATVTWFFSSFFQVGIIALVILFQSEIKHGLILLGSSTLFRAVMGYDSSDIQKIINAVYTISYKKYGAIIVFQRKMSLHALIEKSIQLDASISSELIETIFYHHNPLHDGAIIIRQGRVASASVYLPLTANEPDTSVRRFGTRHRAAIGISEQTDAAALVVSEETQSVSIAFEGKIKYDLAREDAISYLTEILGVK